MIIVTWIALSFLVGFIGIGRNVTFFGAFFFSLLLSPIIGLIIALASKRKEDEEAAVRIQKSLNNINRNSKPTSVADELYKLADLKNKGVISDLEFSEQKSAILNRN